MSWDWVVIGMRLAIAEDVTNVKVVTVEVDRKVF